MNTLAFTHASPFARKVRVVAAELGLAGRLALVPNPVSPVERNDDYAAHTNPLGKIPALTLPDGSVLVDSAVICEFLLATAGGSEVLLPSGAARWGVLSRQAIASGMTDALVLARYESFLRPAALRWDAWSEGQLRKFHNGLTWFERHAALDAAAPDLGDIALACGLGYADFRFPDLGWRALNPRTARWYDAILQRPSLAATLPA